VLRQGLALLSVNEPIGEPAGKVENRTIPGPVGEIPVRIYTPMAPVAAGPLKSACACKRKDGEPEVETMLEHVGRAPGGTPMDHVEYDEVEFTDLEPSGDTGSSTSSWWASIMQEGQRPPQKRRSRRRWQLGSTMGRLLLLAILFTLNHGPLTFMVNSFRTPHSQLSGASSSFAALPPLPQVDGIACLADAALSADTHFIAVLGYRVCPKHTYMPGLVDLYDACSARLIRQLHPDATIMRMFTDSFPPGGRHVMQKGGSSPPVIDYEQVIWSPDSQSFAFTFTLAAQQPSLHGIVLVNRDGGSEQVVLQRQPPSEPLDIDWDLLSHPVVHLVPERSLPQNLCSVY
jgi:hypothetical protein